MIKKTIVFFVFFSAISSLSYAQELVEISLAEIRTAVKKENNTIKATKADVTIAQGEKKETNAFFLPSVSVSHTGISTTNPMMAFGTKLNQGIVTQADFAPNLLNSPSAIQNYSTKISVAQPLVNLNGLFARKAVNHKVNAAQLMSSRTEDQMLLEAEKGYQQLQFTYKVKETLEQVYQAMKVNEKMVNDYVAQGLLQKSDALEIGVRVTEIKNQLQYAESAIKNASGYLSVLMNKENNQVLKPKDELQKLTIDFKNKKLSNNRADIKAMEEIANSYQQMSKASKVEFLPTLNAFGTYEWNSSELFNANNGGYLVGVALQWNLFEGSRRFGKLQKTKAQAAKSKTEYKNYKAQNHLEFSKTQRAVYDAINNIVLAEEALASAKEIYRIKQNRFDQGLEKTSDLLQAETLYAQKKMAYDQSVYEYNTTLLYLNFLTQ